MAFVSDEEYFEIIRKADEARAIQEQEQAAKNQDVIASVRSMVSQEVFEQIKEELNESGEVFDFEIVDEPYGHPQDNGFTLGDVFVEQTSGPCGDDFYGTVAMPLPDGRYFQFGFSC